ncbi:MAG: family 16 glycoside hydrolase, partial [Verrucomicrobiota bacterium]
NLSPGVLNVKAFEDGYLASHNSYRDYVMVFEFRWGTETYADRATKARDSGLIIHSHGSDGTWNNRYLPGLEVQVMEGGMGDIILLEEDVPITAMMPIENVGCGPSTLWNCRGGDRYKDDGSMRTLNQDLHAVHWRLWDKNWSDTKGFRGVNDLDVPYDQNGDPTDEWNRMVTVSNGTQVTVFFNGQLVSECFAVSPDEGKVQVQLERAEYDIGRWELLPLSALDGPSIPTGLPAADLNQPYSETVATSGGVSPYTWSILSGDLPTGLALDPDTGVVAGTPTVEETTVFTLQATDSIGNTATLATSLSVGSGSTTPIENWRQQYFGTTSSTGDAANGFDGDLDGWVNLIEFGLNGIPGATNDHQKYRPSRVAVGDDEYLVLTFPVRDGAVFSTQVAEVDGIRYTLFANDEAGFDGTPLSVVEHTPVQSAGMPTPDPGWSYRSFRIVDPLELRPRAFMQVGVEEITP